MSKFKYGKQFFQHEKVVKSVHNQMSEVQNTVTRSYFQHKIQFQEFKLQLKTLIYVHKTNCDIKMTLNSSVSTQVITYCCCKNIKDELKLNKQLIVVKANRHVNGVSFTSKGNHPVLNILLTYPENACNTNMEMKFLMLNQFVEVL